MNLVFIFSKSHYFFFFFYDRLCFVLNKIVFGFGFFTKMLWNVLKTSNKGKLEFIKTGHCLSKFKFSITTSFFSISSERGGFLIWLYKDFCLSNASYFFFTNKNLYFYSHTLDWIWRRSLWTFTTRYTIVTMAIDVTQYKYYANRFQLRSPQVQRHKANTSDSIFSWRAQRR